MQESEKFVKLYIIELRKAFKARSTGESIRADNFLSLISISSLVEEGSSFMNHGGLLKEQQVFSRPQP